MTAGSGYRTAVVLAVHEEQLAEHGGALGIRDPGCSNQRWLGLGTWLRTANRMSPLCAAAYGYGLARNHPFVDGNKRTAFVAVELFLALNGGELLADDADCVLTMLALAAGDLDEAAFAEWLRRHSAAR